MAVDPTSSCEKPSGMVIKAFATWWRLPNKREDIMEYNSDSMGGVIT
jgi:hypothetical protein